MTESVDPDRITFTLQIEFDGVNDGDDKNDGVNEGVNDGDGKK